MASRDRVMEIVWSKVGGEEEGIYEKVRVKRLRKIENIIDMIEKWDSSKIDCGREERNGNRR